MSAVKRFHHQYKEAAARHGYEASPDQLGWAMPIYVADTDESARREAKPHIEAIYNKFLRMPQEYLLPPGYTSVSSMKKLRAAKSSTTSDAPPDCDEFIRRGMFICGSPDTVRQTHRASPEGHRLQRAGGDDADRQHARRTDAQGACGCSRRR